MICNGGEFEFWIYSAEILLVDSEPIGIDLRRNSLNWIFGETLFREGEGERSGDQLLTHGNGLLVSKD
jgi:hypothetical protein